MEAFGQNFFGVRCGDVFPHPPFSVFQGGVKMELEFGIPDLEVEITIKGGSSRFFDILLLMESIMHYLRTKELIEKSEEE